MPEPAYLYFDYNATAPLRPEVRAAMESFLGPEYGNAASLHRLGQRARAAVDQARAVCAKVLGCSPEEIIFTSGGTESNNLALRGLAWAKGPPDRKARVVCSAIEHPSVRETLEALGRQGFEARWVAPDGEGIVSAEALAKALDSHTRVAALMYAHNEVGSIQPVVKAAEACWKRGVPLHVDAVQAAGRLPMNVRTLGCVSLALSGHKLGGPKGAGLLYLRRGTPFDSPQTGGSQEGGLRGGTQNVAGIVGLAEALRLAEMECAAEAPRLSALRDHLESLIRSGLPRAVVLGPRVSERRLANTSFMAFPGCAAESLVMALDLESLAVSTGSACSEGTHRPSPALEAMGAAEELKNSAVRFSLGKGSGEDQVRSAAERVIRVVGRIS